MSQRRWSVRLLVAISAVAAIGFAAWGVATLREGRIAHADPSLEHEIPAFTRPPEKPDASYLRVIAFGDSGTGGTGQWQVADAMGRFIKENGADFLIMLGDNVYDRGVESVDDPKWDEMIVEPYGRFGLPIWACLGNHDHGGDADAQVERTRNDPHWHMPARHYDFSQHLRDGTNLDFFALDTEPIDEGRDEATAQMTWLDRRLAKSTANWKIVFGHHPVYSHGRGGNGHMKDAVQPLLERYHVDLYLCGHDHSLQVLEPKNGVNYVISGGGGGTDNPQEVGWESDSRFAATRGGFTWLRFSRHELVIEMVRPDAKTQFGMTVAKD